MITRRFIELQFAFVNPQLVIINSLLKLKEIIKHLKL